MGSHGCENMTKRKRNIFTVIEAVPNWFEVGEGDTITSDKDAGSSSWAGSRKGLVEYVAGDTVPKSDKQAPSREGPRGYGNGEAIPGYVSHACSRGVLTEYEYGETAIGADDVAPGQTLFQGTGTEATSQGGIQSQATLTDEANEWLTVARPPVKREGLESEPVIAEDLSDTRSRALNAFWSLLMAAGYEEV